MSKKIQRRDFLQASGAGLAALSFPVPLRCLGTTNPANQKNNILVVIYLRGGQDMLNTIVPYSDPRYYEIRPTISIAPKPEDGEQGVVKLNKKFGLHPAMASLKPLWDAKQLAAIVNCGSPHPTRSHFDAQDFMEYAAPGLRSSRDGWLNRYLASTPERAGQGSALRALAMQGLLPRSLRGQYPVLAVPERGARRAGKFLDLFDDLYLEGADDRSSDLGQMETDGKKKKRRKGEPMRRRDDPVVQSGRNTIETLRRYQQIVGGRRGGQSAAKYPRGRLGNRLADIAKVIKAGERLEVAAVDWNGWDHHTGQGGEGGRHANMVGQVAGSIAAFLKDLGPHAKRTLVLTMTEFGRTCRENGNMGSDHGHGGLMLAAGGTVAGGRILGRWDGLEDKDMYQGRDSPVHTDFRDVMAEVLVRHMGVKKLPKGFFPGYEPSRKAIGLIG